MNRSILVFGMPRSGTTWIGKLFDSHPDTLYRHEPDSVQRLSVPLFPEKPDTPQYRDELQRFLVSLPFMRWSKVVGKRPLFPKSYQSPAALFAYRAGVTAAKAASRIKPDFPVLFRPTGNGRAEIRIVWKSIESPGRLGVCVEALPDCRAIHLLRHPCGYVASVLRGESARRFGDLIPSGEDLWLLRMLLATPTAKLHGLTLDDLKRLSPEERLAWRWVLTHEKILADIGNCERVLTLRYEDVCAEPAAGTRRMFEFAGLDWQAQTENFVRASTNAADTDYYSVYRHSPASADRWRSELMPQVVERIARILRASRLHEFYAEDKGIKSALPEAAA